MKIETNNEIIQLSDTERQTIAEKKATCPFIGAAVAAGELPVLNNISQPLASIDKVTLLGNSGGGDLGEILKLFAKGNHARTFDDTGKPNELLPAGLFSLDFPGSQGSHPGHSGILQGNPFIRDSGRFSQSDFDRLTNYSKNGFIKRSEVSKFIAENLARDPDSKVDSLEAVQLIIQDLNNLLSKKDNFFSSILQKLFRKKTDSNQPDKERELFEAITKLTGENNLVGSAGEFGLLFAFFANKPNAKTIDSEPALSVEDLTLMFKDKKFPSGWETWKKTKLDWIGNTAQLLLTAAKEFKEIKR